MTHVWLVTCSIVNHFDAYLDVKICVIHSIQNSQQDDNKYDDNDNTSDDTWRQEVLSTGNDDVIWCHISEGARDVTDTVSPCQV